MLNLSVALASADCRVQYKQGVKLGGRKTVSHTSNEIGGTALCGEKLLQATSTLYLWRNDLAVGENAEQITESGTGGDRGSGTK